MLADVLGTVYVNAVNGSAATEYARELVAEMQRAQPRVRFAFAAESVRQDRTNAHEVDVRLVVEVDENESLAAVRAEIADTSADATALLSSEHGTFALALWGKVAKTE